MHSAVLCAPSLLRPNAKTQTLEDLHGRLWISEWPQTRRPGRMRVITMRDRSKNRKPTQRGRYLSIEAIQAVQALKRAKISGDDSLDRVLESKVRRLIKADTISVLRELLSQGEGFLALQVFEEVRKEHWYKPRLLAYADMIKVLASNDLLDKVELMCSYLKTERLEADTEGFNLLLETLLEFGFTQSAMDCYRLMKLWNSEPDESTFRILINGLESKGEMDLSIALRQEGEMYFGRPLEFLEKTEEMASTGVAES
ncbi:pentatricopeptide repeat-containing protein At1g62350 [Phoenix dactylifera]|uniref:Pentatricopeptide repeat-containing protein At1g62350 n=1 Tax=Phoenix dactylifera TaxID=42345 RepID=A0A8B9ATS0_PHODC|nr:pentatricopeptide repeat-containing protein At1g62350 [Phoenix dactylifera]